MDKYTVDLDQVLNDFEYSELTDQYSHAPRFATGAASASQNNNITKHSINNVFHSLNEYLNTSISVTGLNQIDNNLEVKNNYVGDVNVLNVSRNKFSDGEKSIKDCNLKTEDRLLDFTSQTKENNVTECEVGLLKDNGGDIVDECKNNSVRVIENEITEHEGGFLEENGGDIVDGYKSNNMQVIENEVTEGRFLEENSDNIVDKYNNHEKPKEREEICTENIVSDRSSEVREESLGYIENKEKTEVLCDDNKERIVCSEDVHTENLENEDPTPEINKEGFSKTEHDNSKINKEEVFGEAEYSKEKAQAIGFHDDLNLDDSEINRLLDELEEEGLEAGEDKKSQAIADIESTGGVEDVEETKDIYQEDNTHTKDNVNVSESMAVEEDVLKQSESPPDDNNSKIVFEGNDNKEAKVESIEASIDLPLLKAKEEPNHRIEEDVETEESNMVTEESNTVIEESNAVREESNMVAEESNVVREESNMVTEESNMATEQSNIVIEEIKNVGPTLESKKEDSAKEPESVDLTLNEEKLKEVVEEKKVECEKKMLVIEKENSQDSLSRPQNLPLKGEGDEPKRKIDLIGDPGSTPYNNVYINKEIPKNKQKSYDSDTDYSTSSSPTFSDVSSTASTVSVDELRNDNCKNLQNSSTNIEKVNVAPEVLERSEAITSCAENPSTVTVNPSDEHSNPTPEIENPTSEKPEQSLPSSGGEEVLESGGNGDNLRNDVAAKVGDNQMGAGAPHVENMGEVNVSAISVGKQWLGKEAPLWIPDSDAMSCLHCDMKFTVLKRRHHCRACGLVLCSKCCHLRFRLQYLEAEARVCNKCHDILNTDTNSSSGSEMSPEVGNSPSYRPHPNNPLDYCSTVSPLQQVAGGNPEPPAVMVPVGVLKRKGSNKGKSNKSVMFCDGIRPGSDLTNLDNDFDYNNTKSRKSEKVNATPAKANKNLPTIDPETNTFIPSNENLLPPTISTCKTDTSYMECSNGPETVELLKNEQLTFAIHVSLNVHLKVISMSCCINKMAWCFSTEGLINVGQDEIVILLEYIDEESFVPKDVFYHINNVYNDAVKGTSVKEMGLSLHNTSNFLDSKNHAGFVYIRPTFQCLENIIKPKEPYLIGILIHRWETPWAKLFPLRLILRLGAEYRYYPSPIISTRHRESVFVEIGHTIINLLADFRNFSYTLPQIRGLIIHMEDKNTTITIPVNRYDQVMKSMNNSSDHILAFAGNFSLQADSHLVCIQDTQGNENCYSTHAINIHNKPRKVTGASFIVFNGALKSSSGLTAKSNIVEDGLMIQVLPEHMQLIRENLRGMKNHTIPCGCVNAASDETVNIVWGENDVNFNIGVVSTIDNMPLNGIPSIRVHNGKNHVCANGSRIIRWTEVFIIQNGDDNPKNQDPVDISRVSENIAKATCDALVKYLDLLVANNCQKIGIRTTLHVENVSYSAGSNGTKLPPIYMKSLDNELIPVLHRITTNNLGENAVVLELIFRILNV